jgi:hypothetical protein
MVSQPPPTEVGLVFESREASSRVAQLEAEIAQLKDALARRQQIGVATGAAGPALLPSPRAGLVTPHLSQNCHVKGPRTSARRRRPRARRRPVPRGSAPAMSAATGWRRSPCPESVGRGPPPTWPRSRKRCVFGGSLWPSLPKIELMSRRPPHWAAARSALRASLIR